MTPPIDSSSPSGGVPHAAKHGRHAFTLMELLAVVAIIGILMALALPVINQMRIKSLYPQTYASMKALHAALLNYANDHNGWSPPATSPPEGYSDPDWGANWVLTLNKGGYIAWAGQQTDDINPLVWKLALHARAPNDSAQSRTCAANERMMRTQESSHGRPLPTIEMPSAMAAFMNAPWNTPARTWGTLVVGVGPLTARCDFSDPPWPVPDEGDPGYEDATMPVIFVDGHIEHVARRDFPTSPGELETNPFWTGTRNPNP